MYLLFDCFMCLSNFFTHRMSQLSRMEILEPNSSKMNECKISYFSFCHKKKHLHALINLEGQEEIIIKEIPRATNIMFSILFIYIYIKSFLIFTFMAFLFSNAVYVISAFWEDRQLIGNIDIIFLK